MLVAPAAGKVPATAITSQQANNGSNQREGTLQQYISTSTSLRRCDTQPDSGFVLFFSQRLKAALSALSAAAGHGVHAPFRARMVLSGAEIHPR